MAPPIAIFYDLETSDKSPIGQILNYSFIAVDQSLSMVAECSGDVRLSRLQLPSPEAILKNRVNVATLQKTTSTTEREAMARIAEFIGAQIKAAQATNKGNAQYGKQKLIFIGYNSSKFDLPFLRTSWIRSGINPYFNGNLLYRDVLLAVRKLSVSHPDFPRVGAQHQSSQDEGLPARLSLSLETVTHALKLLEGAQSHHSRDDVILTIDLAKALRERFGLDVLSYESFEAGAWLKSPSPGRIFWAHSPNYDLSKSQLFERTPFALLEANYRYCLLVNLERFAKGEGRRSIQWFNQAGGALYFGGAASEQESISLETGETFALGELAAKAREECKGITLTNFFPTSTCDIEQDIYRLDMPRIGALETALWGGDTKPLSELKDRDAKVVYLRALLAEYRWQGGRIPVPPESAASEQDAKMAKSLKNYALYRYGGKLQMAKSLDGAKEDEAFHPTLTNLFERLTKCKEQASARGASEDLALLAAVQEYYDRSEIVQIAGPELLGQSQADPHATAENGTT
jgi:hypothetical protein